MNIWTNIGALAAILGVIIIYMLGVVIAKLVAVRESAVETAVRKEIKAWMACMSKHIDQCVHLAYQLRVKGETDPEKFTLYLDREDYDECQRCQITSIDGVALRLKDDPVKVLPGAASDGNSVQGTTNEPRKD